MRYFVIAGLLAGAVFLSSQTAPQEHVGPLPDGGFLINWGWKVLPAGKQVPTGNFPMSSALSKEGKFLLILNGGYMKPSIQVLKTDTWEEVGRTPVEDGWLGLTLSPDGTKVYVGGGSRASVFEFDFAGGALTPARTFEFVAHAQRKWTDFIGDIAISPNGRFLYAASLYNDAIRVVNLSTGRIIENWQTGRRPYRILFHPDGRSFFVTSWADGTLYQQDAETGKRLGQLRLGAHPTDIIWRPKQAKDDAEELAPFTGRLFVSAANTNTVYSVGLTEAGEMRLVESINVAMTPREPLGMTPSALALNPDGSRLYVVCSNANAVAVVDLLEARSHVAGFIPTGWYPIAARVLADQKLLVFNGRGLRSFPNPAGPNPTKRAAPVHQGNNNIEYVGKIQTGTMSVVDRFDDDQLDKYTTAVLKNSPYRDSQMEGVTIPTGNPIPASPGGPTPIRHVIYIMKENRTYDQVLGDIGKGNSDPSLTLFGENITPNQHKLAREFVLFDNFYVSADVSADGHNWSTSAIANDYVEKMWPNSYGARRTHYDYEGGEIAALPPAGYLWTNASSKGVTMRNFGFWCTNNPKPQPGMTQVQMVRDPVLAKVTNMNYRGFDLDYPDVERVKVFQAELAEWEKSGQMPQLVLLRIGNDHTNGTAAGKVAPLSAVADNDHAVGLLVEAVSKSKFWANTAIFILEDDAQNGPDHVDSHRSPVYVLSPYTRRGTVDSSMYNTTSVLRTMELILGLRPMTHFDASAKPMFAAFTNTPDVRPYQAEAPRISTTERNPATAPQAAKAAKMDFDEADRADDEELNAMLWRSIRKTEPPVPVSGYHTR